MDIIFRQIKVKKTSKTISFAKTCNVSKRSVKNTNYCLRGIISFSEK